MRRKSGGSWQVVPPPETSSGGVKGGAENVFWRDPQPLLEQCRVNLAEVDRHPWITGIEVRKRRMITDDPTADTASSQKYGRGGTMVGAGRAILRNATPELTEL